MWVVNGYSNRGLVGYRSRRESSAARTTPSDCFHDDEDVLPEVLQEHKRVLRLQRECDEVTQNVVQMAENMLHRNPTKRPRAEKCRVRAQKFLKQADDEIGRQSGHSQPQLPTLDTRSDGKGPITLGSGQMNESPTNLTDSDEGPPRSVSGRAADQHHRMTHQYSEPYDAAQTVSKSHTFGGSSAHKSRDSSGVQPDFKSAHCRQVFGSRTMTDPVQQQRRLFSRDEESPAVAETKMQDLRLSGGSRRSARPPPHLSFERAMIWYEDMKRGVQNAKLPNHEFTAQLSKRDHVCFPIAL